MRKGLCDTCRFYSFGLIEEQFGDAEVEFHKSDKMFDEERNVIVKIYRDRGTVENLTSDPDALDPPIYKILEIGECRIRSVPNDVFPARMPYDWCGEHEPRKS